MSIWSSSYQQIVFKRDHSEKHLSEFYLQDGGKNQLEGKYSLESTDPRESEIRAHLRPWFSVEWSELRIITYLLCIKWFVGLFTLEKNPRFTAFLDSNLHTRLAIVTGNELGLAFPPRNLPEKISSRSVHVLFSYHGNKQTNQRRWLHNPSRKLSRG